MLSTQNLKCPENYDKKLLFCLHFFELVSSNLRHLQYKHLLKLEIKKFIPIISLFSKL